MLMTKNKTKKISNKQTPQSKPTHTRLYALGIIMLLLSPLLYYVIAAIAQANCPQTEYGGCEMGYGLRAGLIATVSPYIFGTIAIAILIYARLDKKS